MKILSMVSPPNGEIKRFSVQQFFKNAAEVWASSPRFCEAKIEKQAYLHQEKENASRPSPSKIFLSNLQQGCIRGDGRFTQASWDLPALPAKVRSFFLRIAKRKNTCKSIFISLRETFSERSGESASLFACVRCPP